MEETQKKEQSQKRLPDGFRIEQARNYLRMHINRAAAAFDLPGEVVDLIIEGLLSEEQRQRIALMTEQTDYMLNEMYKEKEDEG